MTRSTSPPTPRSPPSPVAAIAAVVTGVAASTENATMLPTLLTTTMVPIDTLSTDHNAAFMSSRTPSPPLSPPLLGEGGNVQVTSVGFSPLATSVDDQTSIIDDADERMQGLAALAQQQENADSMTNKPSSFGVTYVDGMPVTTYQQHVQRLSDDGSDDDEDDYVQDDATTVRAFAAMSTGRQNDKDSTSAAILSYLQKTGGRDSAGESAAEMATPTTMTTSVADPVDTSHSIWNANKLFQIGFRMSAASYSSLDDGDDMQAILDDDARRLLASRDGVAADERMVVARTKDLLRRFLELERPKLTEQMLEFLLMDGVFDVLMNFITRLPWTADSESMHTLDWSLDQADNTVATLLTARDKHVRECHDIDVQKNAYQAVEVLCGTSPSNVRLLDMKQREIVCRLFDVFHPDSDGNLHHANKLFTNLLRRDPHFVLDLVLLPHPPQIHHYSFARSATPIKLDVPHMQKPLLFRALPFIEEPAAREMMIAALFRGGVSPTTAFMGGPLGQYGGLGDEEKAMAAMKMKARFEVLQEQEFLEELLAVVLVDHADKDKGSAIATAAMVDEAILCDNSAILFISLAGDPAPVANLVERLGTSFLTAPATTDTPVNATTTLQKRAIIATLHALVIRTKQAPPRPVGPPAAKPMPAHTPLSSVSRAMCRHLRGHMAALTAYVIDVGRQFNKCDAAGDDVLKLSSYKVHRPLSTDLVQFLECFTEVVTSLDAIAPEIEQIPSLFWKLLVDWFFENSHNNIFHGLFYRLFHQAMRWNHRPTLKALLSKTRLVPRLIAMLKDDPSTGIRGHLILIANVIRLTVDEQHANDYVPQLVDSYAEWKDFVVELIALTEKQVAPVLFKTGAQANAFRPLPQIAPDGVQLDRRPTNPEDDMGVHLGSTYALSLGFRLPLHMDSDRTPVASPVSSRRLSAVGTSAGAAVAPANSRKKKKKKRKSSAAGSANAKAAVAGASVDPASEGSDDEQEDADHGAAVSPLDASSLMDRLAIAASP